MKTFKITILRPAPQQLGGPFTLRFNGPKATVTEATAEFADGGPDLQAVGATNGRRLVPVDPIWWVAFLPRQYHEVPEQIEVEFSTSIASK